MSRTTQTSGQDLLTHYKEEAAERAVEFVQSGMTIGLGTGSTAVLATRRIGLLCIQGKFHDITGAAP